jgi:hypothetical protein
VLTIDQSKVSEQEEYFNNLISLNLLVGLHFNLIKSTKKSFLRNSMKVLLSCYMLSSMSVTKPHPYQKKEKKLLVVRLQTKCELEIDEFI